VARKKNTQVRFLGGYAPRKDLLGVLSFPVGFDGHDVEHTRFFMVTPEKWVHRPIEADIVSVVFEDGAQGKCWWLLGKRGTVHAIRPSGITQEAIPDAGTGPAKYGYLSSIRMIDGVLHACGYCRQVHRRTDQGWVHRDQGILLNDDAVGYSLNDIVGSPSSQICAVGSDGEIAVMDGNAWSMLDSPTNAHLYAVCIDDQGRFCAAGANGTVVRGNADGFDVLCAGNGFDDALWDIEFFRGELVVSATPGVFVVRDGALVPFDRPAAPNHVGYKLATVGERLWSIGTHRIFCLDETWNEWVCPDNAP
jgi:hypothetical protein